MTAHLFIQRGSFFDRHPGIQAFALLIFIGSAEWIASTLAGLL